MIAGNSVSLSIAPLAILTGILGLLALFLLILFFTVGGPFGTLNDICNGLTGISSGILAWTLYSRFQSPRMFFVFALIGALVVAFGSVLILFGFTGWYLAGLYTSMGYALIGVWLLALNLSIRNIQRWSPGLAHFGWIIALVMALGFLVLPGILNRIDAWEQGPWYVNYIGQLGSIGYLLLYPIWCVLLGWSLRSR